MKKICQYTIDGDLVVVWDSASQASKIIGISSSGITKSCHGILKTCGGYIWRHVDRNNVNVQEKFIYGVVVAGLDTLGKWRSIRAAARDLGIDSSLVCKIVNMKRFAWDGVMFVWAETADEAKVICISRAVSRMK